MLKDPPRKFMKGYKPAVYAREGLMFGMRQPLDGPVFEKLEHAEWWCIGVMEDHFDRRLGISDARIVPFEGMVDCYRVDPRLLRDVERIFREVKRQH